MVRRALAEDAYVEQCALGPQLLLACCGRVMISTSVTLTVFQVQCIERVRLYHARWRRRGPVCAPGTQPAHSQRTENGLNCILA